jgi:hypothetical protein
VSAERGFESPRPAVRPAGPHLIETLDAVTYRDRGLGFSVVIPPGLHSDGASVPGIGWAFLRGVHWIDLLPYGILHDYLYRADAVLLVASQVVFVPGRLWADRVGAQALATLGAAQARVARRVKLATMLGGGGSWHRRYVGWRPGDAPAA